ncbi:MAG: sugar ABC transporter substrate-binding protein [Candidatus Gastranaerophilales bacterium]|nr:sugar ABC transporter substrate-binding protein [Candidatus Gastranaerophilales bacterium]MCM1073132.1 sugar ABC transporter substrate-binding protein [Bacteroides sp.]
MKKLLTLILALVLLCGCTKKTQEEITFSSWGSVSEVKILNKIITDFETENPDIKIKFMHIPQNYFQKIHLLFASNTAPDVIFMNNLSLPIYANYLEDLSDEINPDEFYPQSIEGLSSEGKVLAIPRDISNLVFYINLDLIKKPSENWTLEEFLQIAQNATKNGVFGVSFEEDIYWALPYLQAFDESILDDNPQKGLKFYKDLRDKYKAAPSKSQVGSSTLAQMFLDKKIAMYLSGRWMYPKISEKADFNWAVVTFPGDKGVPCDSSGWAISKNSKRKDSAKKFVQYLSSEKSSEYFTQTGLIVPARIKTSNLIEEKAFLNAIKTSVKTPVNKDYKKITDKYRIH